MSPFPPMVPLLYLHNVPQYNKRVVRHKLPLSKIYSFQLYPVVEAEESESGTPAKQNVIMSRGDVRQVNISMFWTIMNDTPISTDCKKNKCDRHSKKISLS